jgi:hypothetical protein
LRDELFPGGCQVGQDIPISTGIQPAITRNGWRGVSFGVSWNG